MSMSFKSEITLLHITRLTFGCIGFDGALRLFPAVDTEAEVDTMEAAIPLLEQSSTVAVAEGLHSTTRSVMNYDVALISSSGH